MYLLPLCSFAFSSTTILSNLYFTVMMTIGLRSRTILTTHLYKKSLKLSPAARQAMSVGQIVNVSAEAQSRARVCTGNDCAAAARQARSGDLAHLLFAFLRAFLFSQMMSTDTAKVDLFCGYMHFIWSGMEQVAVAIALLIRAIGPPALAGLGVVIIMIPFQGMVIRHLQQLRKATVKYTDRRVKLMNEILQGIRVIKVYACEQPLLHTAGTSSPSRARARPAFNCLSVAPFAHAVSFFRVYMCRPVALAISRQQGRTASCRR